MAQASPEALHSSLKELQISPSKAKPKIKKNEPADSWEDEADDSASDTEVKSTPPIRAAPPPAPPPPTPSAYHAFSPPHLDGALDSPLADSTSRRQISTDERDERRPDKTTAVASRLIAAGIGQRAPKRTKEQREYDQALKIQEQKKRDRAREEEDKQRKLKEQALKDVWGD